ncbi:MAG: hypothetical protein ACREQI_09890 [Candidatus Binataceae bacterium]
MRSEKRSFFRTLLVPAKDANQKNPRRSYVYAHVDGAGRMFYIGKGTGKRAWSKDRDELWKLYVRNHLGGNYHVQILQDNLSSEQAVGLEGDWIAQCSDSLVNWVNFGRRDDYVALDRYGQLSDATRALVRQGKEVEKNDLARAVRIYEKAIEGIKEYSAINYRTGLVGKLLDEQTAESGRFGYIEAVNRLTICLIRLGQPVEAARHADDYFEYFRFDRGLAVYDRIARRIEKALNRVNHIVRAGTPVTQRNEAAAGRRSLP